jgi:hypothetical protein
VKGGEGLKFETPFAAKVQNFCNYKGEKIEEQKTLMG